MKTIDVADLVPGMVVNHEGAPAVIASNALLYSSYGSNRESRSIAVFVPTGGIKTLYLPNKVTILTRKNPMKGITITDASVSSNVGTTAGADPEVLTVNKDGEVIPSWEFMPEKNKPIIGEYYSKAFWDGFQSEFTVDPGTCHGHFTDYVRDGLQTVIRTAVKKDPTAKLTIKSAVHIPREKLMKYNPEHVQLGCSPSNNIYEEPPLALPDPVELEWRFAGCHLHYGSTALTPDRMGNAVKMLDATAGIANVALGGEFLCPERRQWYGKAGEYRYHEAPTKNGPHRLEWRVPDTILLSHPATFNLFIDFARQAVRMGAAGLNFLWNAEEAEIRDAVNYCDVELARKILKRNENLVKIMLKKQYYDENVVNRGFQAFMKGIVSVVGDPTDIEKNWELRDDYKSVRWHGADYDRSTKAGKIWVGAVNNYLIYGGLV